jgi:hypothetical protein
MGKKQKSSNYQPSLFAEKNPYDWQNVLDIKPGAIIVDQDEDVKVTKVSQDGSDIVLMLTKATGKSEQIYSSTDSVYAKVEK